MKTILTVVVNDTEKRGKAAKVYKVPFDENTTLEKAFKKIHSEDIELGKYYSDYLWESYGNVCPYIITDGVVSWNVPYNQVNVEDFVNTHNLDDHTIYVDIAYTGSDATFFEDILVQSWVIILFMLQYSGYAFTANNIRHFFQNAFGTRKDAPAFNTIEAFLLNEDEWEVEELIRLTRFPENVLVPILDTIGFEEHEGKYYKNAYKVSKYKEKQEKLDYEEYIDYYLDVNFDLESDPDLAEELTAKTIQLYELSFLIDNQKTYDIVSSELDMITSNANVDTYKRGVKLLDKNIQELEEKLDNMTKLVESSLRQ